MTALLAYLCCFGWELGTVLFHVISIIVCFDILTYFQTLPYSASTETATCLLLGVGKVYHLCVMTCNSVKIIRIKQTPDEAP